MQFKHYILVFAFDPIYLKVNNIVWNQLVENVFLPDQIWKGKLECKMYDVSTGASVSEQYDYCSVSLIVVPDNGQYLLLWVAQSCSNYLGN